MVKNKVTKVISVILTVLMIFSMLPMVYASTEDEYGSREVTGIMISSYPNKTSYKIGEEIDPSGGSIWVNYNDGSYDIVSITSDMISSNTYMSGPNWVNVEYMGYSTYFEINVNRTPVSISAYMNSPRTYHDGDLIDLWDVNIEVYYDDYTSEWKNGNDPDISISDSIAHADSSYGVGMTCSQMITVSYNYYDPETGSSEMLTTDFSIEVEPIRITSAWIDGSIYSLYQGDIIDESQISVSIYYNNGMSYYGSLSNLWSNNIYYSVREESWYSGSYPDLLSFNSLVPGNHRLCLSFYDMNSSMSWAEAYLDVDVIPVNPENCHITSYPYKTTYLEDEYLDLSGLSLDIEFSDGVKTTVYSNDIFNSYYPSGSIYDKSELYKLNWELKIYDNNGYYYGYYDIYNNFDLSQLEPGSYEVELVGYNTNGYNSPDSNRISVCFDIEIVAIDAVECNIYQLPEKTTYNQNESIELSGCEIKVEFNDGHIEYYDALHLNDYYSGSYCDRLNWQTSIYNTKTGESYSIEDFKNLMPGTYEIRFICDSEYHEASTVYTSVEMKIAPYTGDVNLDGSIDICDATLIQYFIAENIYDEGVSAYGDFDGDGQVTVTDVTALQKYLVGITA